MNMVCAWGCSLVGGAGLLQYVCVCMYAYVYVYIHQMNGLYWHVIIINIPPHTDSEAVKAKALANVQSAFSNQENHQQSFESITANDLQETCESPDIVYCISQCLTDLTLHCVKSFWSQKCS